MPTYTCEKCGRLFKQKSGYDDHMSKKTPCEQTSMITAVIDAKVEEKVKAAVRAVMPKAEITKETLPAFFEDLHNLLWNKAGLSPERALEHMTFFFAYRLIEPQADALQLPQECRWSYLASHKNENDTYETMKKGCVAFQKNKVTKPFFKKPEIDKAMIIYEIVEQISRISLTILQETDTLGDIFEYMLGRGMSTMSDEGQYFTNRAICKLAFKLAYDIKKTLRRADGSLCTFADWFCGTGGFPAEFVKGVNANDPSVLWTRDAGALYCQDMNLSSVTTTLLNMLILTGIPFNGDTIRGGNSFTDAITVGAGAPFPGLTVDYCFMNPPYGGDKSKGKDYKFAYSKTVKGDDGSKSKKFFVNQEIQSIGVEDDDKVSAGVQLAMATLSEGGVCCIVLPQGFFFGASKKCVELRKKIVEDYKIWSVVDIASGAFKNTGTKTSMMVFQKGVGATESIEFISLIMNEPNSIPEYCVTPLMTVSLEDLREKNYSLNYKQYLPQSAMEVDGFEMVKLGDVCEWQMGKRIVKDQVETGEYPVYGGGGITFYTNTFNRNGINCKISREGMSESNCVLMIYDKYHQNSQGMTVVSKDANRALNSYIWNWLIVHKKDVYDCGQGTAQKAISMTMLNDLEIPLPSLEKQQEIVEQIDFYTQIAHTEEQSLKILEKIVMGWVKEMGRGKERVKLGEVCHLKSGYAFKSSEFTVDPYHIPVLKITHVNNGSVLFGSDIDRIPNNQKYDPFIVTYGDSVISLTGLTDGKILAKYTLPYVSYLNQRVGILCNYTDRVSPDYIYYYLLQNTSKIIELGVGSCQKNVSPSQIMDLQIPLPSLAEQQTLQSDFDEIRHKHAKIAEYKAKAQEAIQRLIPGANTKAANAATDTAPTESATSMSHSSTCEVNEDGHGCTCRLPLEKEDLSTTASASAAVAIPEVSATAAVSAPPVRRRPTKVAVVE